MAALTRAFVDDLNWLAAAPARAAEIPLSAVLFTPLRWTAAARPDFYQERLVPFLQDLGHHASRS